MDAPLRLTLFGSPAVGSPGAGQALPLERRTQLVVLLALRRGWVPRAELAGLLWPELNSKLAYANLRKTLFRLQALPWAPAPDAQGAALRLAIDTDVATFEAALREGRHADALAAYRGELLAGFDDGRSEPWTRWLAFERERLQGAWRQAALERLAAESDAARALELTARLLEADPLDEAALLQQMQWLLRDGQAAAARQAYRAFAERLATELQLEPGPELRALHDTIGAPARATAALRPASAAALRDDGFVGRTVELRRIGELLARDECRLLSLIGPGGVGKTRLAEQVCRALAARFDDGAVHFVALEDVTSAEAFADRLARTLALPRGRDGALERVIEALRTRRSLLVLDNFEQLADHAAVLERLLQAAPQLKLLVTSRVRLALAGEWSMPVEGLPFPEPEDDDRAEAFDAVRLFVRAAQRVEPALVPATEMAAIVDICRQVEGLPLALELAAACVRVLSCREIADELRRDLTLLRARGSVHPARHASIEAVFQQSWQRLAPAEREVLARLSVFQGGFSAAAARSVAAASLPVLGALADKSLLRRDGGRMQLHPLVQQLAAAQLGEGDACGATLTALAQFFHRWLGQMRPATESGDGAALRAIDLEFENCRRAWRVAVERGLGPTLRSSARTLLDYCDYRGRFDEGLALLREAVDSPLGASDRALQAHLRARAAHLEYRLDRYAEAVADAQRALADAGRAPDDEDTREQATLVLGACALQLGHLPDARRHYQALLARSRQLERSHNIAALLDNLALVEKRLGRHDEALRLSSESLVLHRRIGDSAGVALCLNNLGTLHLLLKSYDAAGVHLREALAISERDGLVSTREYALTNLADLAIKTGDLDAAQVHLERAIELTTASRNRLVGAWLGLHRAQLAVRRGDLDDARGSLAGALETVLAVGAPSLKALAVLTFAELLDAQREGAAALRVLAVVTQHPSISVSDRDELRAELTRRLAPGAVEPPAPPIALDDLLNRIVVERDTAHAALIGALAASGRDRMR